MKFTLLPALALLMAAGWATVPAQAAGCLKGAAVGGVAGHFAGHHGVLGAGAGCVIGHHEATKHAREKSLSNNSRGSNSVGQASLPPRASKSVSRCHKTNSMPLLGPLRPVAAAGDCRRFHTKHSCFLKEYPVMPTRRHRPVEG